MGPGMTVKDSVGANVGGPFTVELGGETISFKLLDQDAQAALEDALVSKKRAMLLRDKQFQTASEYAALYNDFTDRVTTGHYCFTSELMDSWLKSVDGAWTMLSLLSGKPYEFFKNLSFADPTARDEIAAIVGRVWKDSFPNS